MKILVSNDDGYQAPGMLALVEMLQQLDFIERITVVAPDRDRSGASHSLTLDQPLRPIETQPDFYQVNGTPTDCVHLAINGLLDFMPDMVISGINAGANLGDDVLYSGTVAAAMEGRFLGLPAIAISMGDHHTPQYYSTATQVLSDLIKQLFQRPLPRDMILNINVPNVPFEQLKGIHITRLGHRHQAEPMIKAHDPRGRTIYWLGPPGNARDDGEGTDFYALSQHIVSITPLQIDLTCHADIPLLKAWLSNHK